MPSYSGLNCSWRGYRGPSAFAVKEASRGKVIYDWQGEVTVGGWGGGGGVASL